MNVDEELDLWREQWQSGDATMPDLRGRVERGSRWMKFMLALDIAVTATIGGWVSEWAVRSREGEVALLAAATWSFIAAAWYFALKYTRGSWAPAALDTASFLDLLIRRCRGRIKALRFGAWLYSCEMTFCLVWVSRRAPKRINWFSIASVTVVFFAALLWYRRKKLAELEWLTALVK